MPDLSGVSKQDILRYLSGLPGAVGFEPIGSDYNSPRFSKNALVSTWASAMKNPEYDEEIERLLLKSANQVKEVLGESMKPEIDGGIPKLRFLQEMTQGSAAPNLGVFGKRMKQAK